ncbi:MAG TPA: transcriptional repressor [Pyrinomonadaceae bacterium]|nr:transcriptional repressor [Pyrinomonadaceae bacterium]
METVTTKKDAFETEREIFLEHIKTAGLRRTEQRDLILDTFLSTEEHLTSEDLHGLIHRLDPTVGLTTVYRTLKLLTEAGLAREVRFGDGKTYYEHHYNHEHHDHMICTECGTVIEFFSPEIEALQDQMASNFGFKPTHHSLRLWGLCPECQVAAKDAHAAPSGAQPRVRVRTAIN